MILSNFEVCDDREVVRGELAVEAVGENAVEIDLDAAVYENVIGLDARLSRLLEPRPCPRGAVVGIARRSLRVEKRAPASQ